MIGRLIADRRLAVGHEEDERQTSALDGRTHRFAQRAFDVRAALRLERVEISGRFAKIRRRRGNEIVAERADVAREIDETEPIRRSQRAEQLLAPRRVPVRSCGLASSRTRRARA